MTVPPHVSVSRLTGLARCGLASYLERVERVPGRQAGWTIQGLAIHHAVDVWEKSGRTISTQEAQRAFTESWRAELAKADQICPDRSLWLVGGRKKVENDLRDRYADGLRQVADYIGYNLDDTSLQPYIWPDGSIAAEVGFEIPFGGVLVRGFIDVVMQDTATGQLVIRDVKSGSKPPVVPFQLIVYAKALKRLIGEDVAWGQFFMTRTSTPVLMDLTKLDDEHIERWFATTVAMIDQGLYLPNPGDACRTCSVIDACPLMN